MSEKCNCCKFVIDDRATIIDGEYYCEECVRYCIYIEGE